MTDKELIQALRWCGSGDNDWGCIGCPGEKICGKLHGKTILDAADRLEALLAENEHLREVAKMVPKWVRVDERLPDENSTVLVYRPNMERKILLVHYGKFWEDGDVKYTELPIVEEDKQISLIGAVADVVTMISECQPVDAAEVCYCKDCKHFAMWADGRAMNHINRFKAWICPECGWFVGEQYTPTWARGKPHNQQKCNFCSRCGQRIDWQTVESGTQPQREDV